MKDSPAGGESRTFPGMNHAAPLFRKFLFTLSLVSAIVLALGTSQARAADSSFKPENGFGIGFVLGVPTGITASLPLGPTNAVNATIGYDLNGPTNLYAHADYVWFLRDFAPLEGGRLAFYYGPGAFSEISRDAALGVRAVAGLEYRLDAHPLQFFLEIAPGMTVLPETRAESGAGLGLRFFF